MSYLDTFFANFNMVVRIAGFFSCKENEVWANPKAEFEQNKFYYITKGKCIITINGKEYYGEEGSFFFIPANTKHSYHNIQNGTFEKYWFHFDLYPNSSIFKLLDLNYCINTKDDDIIGDIMNENIISLNTLMDQEEVAAQFKKYGFTSMPVVDNENRLVGIITVDDVMDIVVEEATEDMEMMAAILPGDKPYMRTSVWENFKKRIPWLLLLMVSAAFTGAIISSFEDALSVYSALIAFIPMLMGTGGNAGGQASVTVIRGLSMGEIEYRDVPGVMWKEIRVATLCGLCLALANFAKLMIIDQVGMPVALVVSLTLIVVVLMAMILGCLLPVLAKRIGLDPAVMASPFITTIVDALSLMVYFRVAVMVLGINV